MPSATSTHSPSPPPSAPLPSTPGPRATAFISLYHSALSSTISSISYNSFASCFPHIAVSNPGALKSMHISMTTRLEGFAKEEFERILNERKVVEGLNGLEVLVGEARGRRARVVEGEGALPIPVPPHTLPPDAILSAHLSGIHTSQQSQLNAKLQTTQSQNAMLAEKLVVQRKEMGELVGLLERVVGDLEEAGVRLGEEVREGLDGGARDAEEVMVEI